MRGHFYSGGLNAVHLFDVEFVRYLTRALRREVPVFLEVMPFNSTKYA